METELDFRAEDILAALLPAIERFAPLGTDQVIRLWEQASTWALGKPVRVDMGNRTITGVTAGLDPTGFLRVRQENGSVEVIVAGGVRPL